MKAEFFIRKRRIREKNDTDDDSVSDNHNERNFIGYFTMSVAFLTTGKVGITPLRYQKGWKGKRSQCRKNENLPLQRRHIEIPPSVRTMTLNVKSSTKAEMLLSPRG